MNKTTTFFTLTILALCFAILGFVSLSLSGKNLQITDLTISEQRLVNQLDSLTNSNQELTNLNDYYKLQLEDVGVKIEVLQSELETNRTLLEQIKEEAAVSEDTIVLLQTTITNLNELIADKTATITELNDVIANNTLVIAELNTTIDELVADLNASNELYKQLINGSITELKAENFQGVTKIRPYAFYNCTNLTSVTLPNTVTVIDKSAFSGCSKLTSIDFSNNLQTIGNSAFYKCYRLDFEEFPSNLKTVDDSAFYGCESLSHANLPDSVTTLGSTVFQSCYDIAEIHIPTGISVLENAVYQNTAITEVFIPTNIADFQSFSHFSGCSKLETVTFEDGIQVEDLPNNMFMNCTSLESIEIPASVKSLGISAFNGCTNLTNVTFEEGTQLTSFGSNCFYGCPLDVFVLPSGVKVFENAFETGYINNLVIPADTQLESFDSYSLRSVRNESLSIPATVTSLGTRLFWQNSSVKYLTINSNVDIPSMAFYVTNFTSITLNVTEVIGLSTAGNVSNVQYLADTIIYVPANLVESFKAAPGWSSIAANIQAIPETVDNAA